MLEIVETVACCGIAGAAVVGCISLRSVVSILNRENPQMPDLQIRQGALPERIARSTGEFLDRLYDACVKVLWAFAGMVFVAVCMYFILSHLAELARAMP